MPLVLDTRAAFVTREWSGARKPCFLLTSACANCRIHQRVRWLRLPAGLLSLETNPSAWLGTLYFPMLAKEPTDRSNILSFLRAVSRRYEALSPSSALSVRIGAVLLGSTLLTLFSYVAATLALS